MDEQDDSGTFDPPLRALDPHATLPEGIEYLGSYRSLAAYMRAMLEPELTPACAWILDHLDYHAVQRRWQRDGSRLAIEAGHVYRLAPPSPPDPLAPHPRPTGATTHGV